MTAKRELPPGVKGAIAAPRMALGVPEPEDDTDDQNTCSGTIEAEK